jgi:hypothetical protein
MPTPTDHHVDPYDAWHWPETQALLKRLGVDATYPTTEIVISFRTGFVGVRHEWIATEPDQTPDRPSAKDNQ